MVHQSADGDRHSMAPMLFGLRVVMLGRQGSGKGTQGVQLARLLGDPRWDQVRDLADMPTHLRSEIHHFFDVYKALEPGKSSSTTGFEGREAALGEIAAARARLQHEQRTGAAERHKVLAEAATAWP